MDRVNKQWIFLIGFGVSLFAILTNIEFVIGHIAKGVSLILPVLAGLIIALFLSVPMNGFQKRIRKIADMMNMDMGDKSLRGISFALTVLSVVLVIFIMFKVAIPEFVKSISSILQIIEAKLPEWIEILSSYNVDTANLTQFMQNLDMAGLIEKVMGGAGALFDSVIDVSTSIVSLITTSAIAIVIAIYVLLEKKEMGLQCKKVLYACFNEKFADKIIYVAATIQNSYTKFLSGQCVEAVILGSLIFIAFTICKLPYAGLIAILTGVFALIPYIGAFISCFIGAFLTLLYNPSQVIVCLAVYLTVQFVENQFIYPHVVGSSIGLSPVWTLLAAVVGSSLFGVLGMIFFIPLTAALYTIGREWVNIRLEARGLKDKVMKEKE